MIIDELSLELGIDIPFLEAGVTIHQPRLKEIAYVTEHRFWLGCQLLKFDKENLTEQDKNSLSNWSNFNIIMSMIQEKNMESQQAKLNVLSILTLLFPNYTINLGIKAIQLQHSQTKEIAVINNNNFENIILRVILLKNQLISLKKRVLKGRSWRLAAAIMKIFPSQVDIFLFLLLVKRKI